MLCKATLDALTVANEVVFLALGAAACCAVFALTTEALLAADALAVEAEVARLALLALQSVVAFFAVDVKELAAWLTSRVLEEKALNAAFMGESVLAD